MKRTTLLVAVGVTFLLALGGCSAMGSSSSEEDNSPSANSPKGESETPVTPTPIVGATLGEVNAENDDIKVQSVVGSADIAIVKVVIKPGGSTGWHHHPGVVLVPVKAGAVSEYHQDCHKTVYKAGKGFVETNGDVHLVRNEGDVDAVLYATFLIPTGTPPEKLTIADPQPKHCDVK
jgi:quercetin dioxygenase-like cupin family protein